ncbi:MAG: dihydroxy-acid dehydratase [Candidatus Micrarchaeaceae archaeon]
MTSAIIEKDLGDSMTFVTDGGFSGATKRLMVGHVSPEAFVGCPIALVKKNDIIAIDCETGTLDLEVKKAEINNRKKVEASCAKIHHRTFCAVCKTFEDRL